MVLTEAQKEYKRLYRLKNKERLKEQKKEQDKRYYEKNKDKIAEYQRQYNQDNKERIAERKAEYNQQHRQDNREYYKEYGKVYREENKERIALYHKEHNKTPKGIKVQTLSNWRQRGVIGDLEQLYILYINTDKCMHCEKGFADSVDRCLDHDHETGLYRAVLCRSCNTKDILNN